jgi:hypothetical protein
VLSPFECGWLAAIIAFAVPALIAGLVLDDL